jgi:hypothetical protein
MAMIRLKTLWGGARRRLLVYLRPVYVIKSLLSRKGDCKACGTCCKLNLPKCRYLNGKKCEVCWVFPIDRKDQELSDVEDVCGYYWDKPKG